MASCVQQKRAVNEPPVSGYPKLFLVVGFALGFPIVGAFFAVAFKSDFALDGVAANFAGVFLGEGVAVAFAAHFEGDFVAGDFAVGDFDVFATLAAVDGAGDFVAFGLELEDAGALGGVAASGRGPSPGAVNVGGLGGDGH